jgi:hypothetical protein
MRNDRSRGVLVLIALGFFGLAGIDLARGGFWAGPRYGPKHFVRRDLNPRGFWIQTGSKLAVGVVCSGLAIFATVRRPP